MGGRYRKLKEKARGCRDREIRIKLELFLLAEKLGNVSEACSRRGYSRKFYYKWWNRFKRSKWDLNFLKEYSRRPRSSPKQTDKEVEKRVLFYARRQYGARMIQSFLSREGIKISRTTICHILNHRVKRKKKKKRDFNPHRRRYELVIPGQRFQLDVKYVPEFVEGKRIYSYVIVDECTRWRYARGYPELNEQMTFDFLERFKQECPFPIDTIQTDNGFEFTYRMNPQMIDSEREHLMDQWCRTHGISHRLIPPGAKELNGKVERSHRIDEQYFYWRAPRDTLANFNNAQMRWIEFYNENRPHGGLGYQTPKEKLLERHKTLKMQSVEFSLEKLRLNFIHQYPIQKKMEAPRQPELTRLDKLTASLELELKKLRNVA